MRLDVVSWHLSVSICRVGLGAFGPSMSPSDVLMIWTWSLYASLLLTFVLISFVGLSLGAHRNCSADHLKIATQLRMLERMDFSPHFFSLAPVFLPVVPQNDKDGVTFCQNHRYQGCSVRGSYWKLDKVRRNFGKKLPKRLGTVRQRGDSLPQNFEAHSQTQHHQQCHNIKCNDSFHIKSNQIKSSKTLYSDRVLHKFDTIRSTTQLQAKWSDT